MASGTAFNRSCLSRFPKEKEQKGTRHKELDLALTYDQGHIFRGNRMPWSMSKFRSGFPCLIQWYWSVNSIPKVKRKRLTSTPIESALQSVRQVSSRVHSVSSQSMSSQSQFKNDICLIALWILNLYLSWLNQPYRVKGIRPCSVGEMLQTTFTCHKVNKLFLY